MLIHGHTICPKNWGMMAASEVFHRVYYVYGGEAYYTFDNRTERLRHGRLYVFPTMRPYTMWQNEQDPLDVLWFHIETDSPLCGKVVEMNIENNSVEMYLLEALRLLVKDAKDFKNMQKIFGVLLGQILEQMQLSPQLGGWMDTVLAYVEKNVGAEMSVQGLADMVNMERTYFSKKFKSIYNMTPQQFVTAKKMQVACGELMRGASIYEAAVEAGYTDEKAFSRAFKRYMEISPGQYRKARWVQP